MNRRVFTVRLISMLLASGSLVVAGCTDNDYDFDQIDATIGIGGDGLELPANSTADIKLKDVLDLEEDGVVVEDEETHDYVLRQTGNDVAAAHPYIAPIVINVNHVTSTNHLVLSLSSAARRNAASRALTAGSGVLRGEGDVYDFQMSGNKPQEVLALSSVGVDGKIAVRINLRDIHNVIDKIDKVELTFPAYMKISVAAQEGVSVKDNVLTVVDKSTASNLNLEVSVDALDFTKSTATDKLAISGDKVEVTGHIHLALETSSYSSSALSGTVSIGNVMDMDDMTVNSARGKFNPSIDLSDLGDVRITGVPDFLKDGNVVVDLYNPVIELRVQSNMGIGGLVSGTLIAEKDGKTLATVDVPEFKINSTENSDGTSIIYICRRGEGLMLPTIAQCVDVPNLSDLVKTIPDRIRFVCNARANSAEEGSFELGKRDYSIQPSYSIDAPIAFAEDAVIEYNDTFDGWNDDIKDYQLAKGGSLELTAQVSNGVPAFLNLEATPIDAQGNEIAASELEVAVTGNIAASQDGVNPATSPLSIKITQLNDDALKKLDGIRIKVLGKASSEGQMVTGITLNAERHTLKLNDIKVKLVGKVIADLN